MVINRHYWKLYTLFFYVKMDETNTRNLPQGRYVFRTKKNDGIKKHENELYENGTILDEENTLFLVRISWNIFLIFYG